MPRIHKGPFTFEAAHRLQRHGGKCRNLHGHSYQVFVHIDGQALQTEGPATGMLIDFGELSNWWKAVERVFDHTTILEEGDPIIAALDSIGREGTSVVQFPWAPTAENMAVWLQEDAWKFLNASRNPGDYLQVHVDVYETAKSWASA